MPELPQRRLRSRPGVGSQRHGSLYQRQTFMPYEKLEISTPVPVLSWANHALGSDETKMAKNVASLPFVFKHVALMPDVHLGKGALVGSVVATKEAIMPAAVGVDIGCFTGDTLVPLADGKSYPIGELAKAQQEFVVYSCTETQRIVAAKATAKLTRRNAELLKVVLDNGEEIKCTPDHQFMLRNGTYQEAGDLKAGASLMPFYSQVDKDGYILIQQPYSGRWQKAHWVIARSGLLGKVPSFNGQKTVIHHKNFEQADNRPENLEFMGDKDHSAYHRSLVEKNTHWQSLEFEEKRKQAIAAKATTPDGYRYYSERGTKHILQYMQERPEHFRASVSGNGARGKQFLIQYNTSEKGRYKSKEIANRIYICETCGDEVKSPIGLHNHRKNQHGYNHKVVEIIPLAEREDVYCLTVPEYGNFALSAGVFVHNCGMMAIKTPFTAEQLEGKLKQIRLDLEAAIPVGFNENKDVEKAVLNWQGWRDFKELHSGVKRLESKAMKQMGSLGGGNHFIEVCLDTENSVWLMLHSGSRNIGNMLAQNHIGTAKELAKLAGDRLPDPDLAYFVAGTPEFATYWHDLQWAQDYARFNRDVMMARFKRIVEKHLAGGKQTKPLLSVNCHHNYAEKEVHFGEDVYVTRKGAVRAREEDYGIIPGSMGAKSFIVKGKGNAESYCSCSHGAGRLMSRNKAKNVYTLDDLIQQTNGVECRKDEGVLDEIPGAYKPIEQVMANQADLVEVVATLKQVVCIKG
uniref:RtcB family protein n=2 Tax=Cyanobacteriota TaxID=1117 RepID=UPI0030DDD4C1